MGHNQIQKFITTQDLYQCPLCSENMEFIKGSLYCSKGHCFDISAKGYINFICTQKCSKGYNDNFFESRKKILEYGFYDHILVKIEQCLSAHSVLNHIVDAGCGEGYYAKNIQKRIKSKVIGFDFSKEAIQIAAKGGNDVCWLVSDIAKIPLKSNKIDCLLNIFTPANYSEFRRVLTDNGIIVKVIPGQRHLSQLRYLVRDYIRNETYSNKQVVDYFMEQFILIDRIPVTSTFPIQKEQQDDLLNMTPLLFGVDREALSKSAILEITIDAELFIGRVPNFSGA